MKPILLALIFWGCAFFLSAAGLPGYYYSARFNVGMLHPEVYDTAITSPDLFADLSHRNQLPKIVPQPGSKLNYTQIMFEHPRVKGADEYMIEVTLDDGSKSFVSPLVKRIDSSTAIMLSNFEFGKKYVWRYTGLHSGKELAWNGPYNFETLSNPITDKKLMRARVLQNDSLANAGGLIVLDLICGIIDRKGNFVWFLPDYLGPPVKYDEKLPPTVAFNDLRISRFGTLTLLNNGKAEEMDLRGNVLWMAPKRPEFNPDSLNTGHAYQYHHCFKRLESGNYMVIDRATDFRSALSVFGHNNSSVPGTKNDTEKVEVTYEIIKEFDSDGNLVWNWSSENYFDFPSLNQLITQQSDPGVISNGAGGHMNTFEADEKNGFIYAGFRNASRIIKIDKRTGHVVCAWGAGANYRDAPNAEGFFAKQHGLCLLNNGSIAVFNNGYFKPENAVTGTSLSSVVVFTQPSDNGNSKLAWKFDCRLDSLSNFSQRGGNVIEMENDNLLVCMGSVDRIFEVNPGKRVVWNAVVECHVDSSWREVSLNRAHYTSSLYPCYFTIQTNCDTLNSGQVTFQLKVFNNGTEDDSYDVDILSQSGNYKKQFSTSVLRGGKSITFQVSPVKLPAGNDEIRVSVKSATNPDFIRTAYVQYQKQ